MMIKKFLLKSHGVHISLMEKSFAKEKSYGAQRTKITLRGTSKDLPARDVLDNECSLNYC